MALWDHNSPIPEENSPSISNSCQPHRYTSADQQLPSGNPEHHGLGLTLEIPTVVFPKYYRIHVLKGLGFLLKYEKLRHHVKSNDYTMYSDHLYPGKQ